MKPDARAAPPSDLRPLPFSQLLDRGVAPALGLWRQILLPVALPLATLTAVAALVQLRAAERLLQMMAGDGGLADTAEVLTTSFGSMVIGIGLLLFQLLGFGVISVAAMDVLSGRPVAIGRAWRFMTRPSSLWTIVLMVGLSFVSALACLVPAIAIVPMMSLVLPVMIEENRSGWPAIQRSFALIASGRGRKTATWGRCVGIALIGVAIIQALGLLVQGPFLIVQQLLIARDVISGGGALGVSGLLWLDGPMSLLGTLVSIMGWIYVAFTFGLLYREVRRRREGFDLAAAIDHQWPASRQGEDGHA